MKTMHGGAVRRILGLDLSKKTFKCCTLTQERNFQDRNVTTGSMTPEGRMAFTGRLRAGDLVVMEGGTSSYNFAREISSAGVAEVVVLNPSKLHIIFQSQCKTDRQDCVKLANYARDTCEENWVSLQVPTEEEADLRSALANYDALKQDRTRAVNRLHALFNQHGVPTMRKSDLADNDGRIMNMERHLDGMAYELAAIIEREVSTLELMIGEVKEMIRDLMLEKPVETVTWMSIPGVGMMTAASLIAYVGDGSRFSRAQELRNYIGFVPRIDQSGNSNNIGRVSRYGCKTVRKNLIQGALSVEKVGEDCPLKAMATAMRMNGKCNQKVAVAVANKILTIGLSLLKSNQLYNAFGDYSMLKRKLREAGLAAIDTSSFPALG